MASSNDRHVSIRPGNIERFFFPFVTKAKQQSFAKRIPAGKNFREKSLLSLAEGQYVLSDAPGMWRARQRPPQARAEEAEAKRNPQQPGAATRRAPEALQWPQVV